MAWLAGWLLARCLYGLRIGFFNGFCLGLLNGFYLKFLDGLAWLMILAKLVRWLPDMLALWLLAYPTM
jgi:hypothetical protein